MDGTRTLAISRSQQDCALQSGGQDIQRKRDEVSLTCRRFRRPFRPRFCPTRVAHSHRMVVLAHDHMLEQAARTELWGKGPAKVGEPCCCCTDRHH